MQFFDAQLHLSVIVRVCAGVDGNDASFAVEVLPEQVCPSKYNISDLLICRCVQFLYHNFVLINIYISE